VYGATGLVGGRVCTELDAAGCAFAIAGRRAHALERLGELFPSATRRVATLDDPASLERAFAGARVVIHCAGPIGEAPGPDRDRSGGSRPSIGEPVLMAALAAGAHYVDLGGDQAFLHAMYERHESTARHAGRAVVQGCAVNGALGDLAAAWAAHHVCSELDAGDVVRSIPAARLAEDQPLEELAVSYVFDDLVLSPASQRAVFANLQSRGLAWRRDRWESVAPGSEHRRVNAGPHAGGERDVVSFPGGEVLTLPRHVAARAIQTYVSTTRNPAAAAALRLLARAMPLVPRRASELFATYTPADDEYARTRFAVIGQARRAFTTAQVVVSGRDLYRTSAVIAAWVARALVARTTGPIGMLAPSELFRPAAALAELAHLGELSVAPSFGSPDRGINES
jgi:short subunit dehydrogenase-like uncharacterized protein